MQKTSNLLHFLLFLHPKI